MRSEGPEVVLDAHADLGEGPAWDAATDTLLWVDVLAGRVHRFDPASGSDTAISVGQAVSVAVPRADGGLALALRDGLGLLDPPAAAAPDGALVEPELLVPIERDDPSLRANDGACDPRGRLWVGTMAYEATPGRGSLYRIDPDGTLTRHLERLTISNGIAWSPDGRTMYHVDSAPGTIDAYDFDARAGVIGTRRALARISAGEGLPDGLAVAVDGSLFVAIWGGAEVRRYAADGTLLERISFPVAQPTSCCFRGPGLATLFVTSACQGIGDADLARQPHAGALFELEPDVPGLPTTPFAG